MNKIFTIALLLVGLKSVSQTPGTLDATFGTSGKVITSVNTTANIAYSVALQADGKIIVGGTTSSLVTGKDFVCLRYNSDGSLDPTFGIDGIATFDIQIGSDDVAFSVALQQDGKIILGGYSDNGTNKNAALVRLNIDGTLDTSFGNLGKTITDFVANRADEIKVVKIHALTGNIIVGGTSILTSTNSQAVIARYNANGILDNTFSNDGIAALSNSPAGNGTYYSIIEDLAIKPNGKISAVGWIEQQGINWSSNYYGCRLNSNGTLDTTFAEDGVIITNGSFNGNDRAYSLILNSDDSFTFAGAAYITTLQYDYVLGKYNSLGTAAALNAYVPFANDLNIDIAYGLAKDNSGKYILAGSTGTSTAKSFGVTQLNSDYTLDTTFNSNGKVNTTFGTNAINEAYDVVVQPDNKIIVVGYSGSTIAIARYFGDEILGVGTSNKAQLISVYPNPAENTLNIILTDDIKNSEYQIIDTSGRIVKTGEFASGTDDSINISDLRSGMYFIKIKNIAASLRFIKK